MLIKLILYAFSAPNTLQSSVSTPINQFNQTNKTNDRKNAKNLPVQ